MYMEIILLLKELNGISLKNRKTFSITMIEYIGMAESKTYANKVGMGNTGGKRSSVNKLNKPHP